MFQSSNHHGICRRHYHWEEWWPWKRTKSEIKDLVMSNIRSQRSKQIMLPNRNSSLNSQMATKWCTKLKVAYKKWAIFYWSHTWNFKVTRAEKSAIRLLRFERFQTIIPGWIHGWLWNMTLIFSWGMRVVPYWFSRSCVIFQNHTGQCQVHADQTGSLCLPQLSNLSHLPCCICKMCKTKDLVMHMLVPQRSSNALLNSFSWCRNKNKTSERKNHWTGA